MENRTHPVVKLPSGLTLLVVERPNSKAFSASITLPVGENDAPDEHPQLAHLVEHLAFLGENRERSELVNGQGGYINALTAVDYTQFQAYGHIELLEPALLFLFGVLNPAAIGGDDLMQERRVLEKEFVQDGGWAVDDCALRIAHRAQRLLGANKLQLPVAQYIKTLHGVKEDTVNRFRQTHYRPHLARLVIVSALTPSAIAKLLPDTTPQLAALQTVLPVAVQGQTAIERDDFIWNRSFSDLNITYRSADSSPIRYLAGSLLEDNLENGHHSPFFKHLRQELGTTYSVDVNFSRLFDRSLFKVRLELDKRDMTECLTWIIQQLDLLAEQGWTEATFESLRRRFLRKQDLWFEGAWQVAAYLGWELLREDSQQMLAPEDFRSLAEGMTLESVNRELRSLLAAENRYITIVGPMRMLGRWRLRRQLAKSAGNPAGVELKS